jgi:methionine-gamma-lyase
MTGKKSFSSLTLHDYRRFEMTESHVPPLHLTSSFNYKSVEDSVDVFTGQAKGHVYSRYGNPNVESVAQKIADLEAYDLDTAARGLFTTNGMSAIHVLLEGLLRPGDEILTQGDLYGGTTELLLKVIKKHDHKVHQVDVGDLDHIRSALQANPNISLLYLETPTNPTLACVDLQAISAIAKENDCITVVDNTFCTPYLQRPLTLGIDFVLHSTTKYLNGHGTGLGGCIVGLADRPEWKGIWEVMKLTGGTGNPFDAWLVYQGLKTLPLRMEKHCANALSLAKWLEEQSDVTKVHYPGLKSSAYHEIARQNMSSFGGMLSFDIGSQERAMKVMNALKMATIAPTLGDVDTLVLHPATSSHLNVDEGTRKRFGITEGMIRVSVGLEDIYDLIADFEQALVR